MPTQVDDRDVDVVVDIIEVARRLILTAEVGQPVVTANKSRRQLRRSLEAAPSPESTCCSRHRGRDPADAPTARVARGCIQ
jgi:hypothetical protein